MIYIAKLNKGIIQEIRIVDDGIVPDNGWIVAQSDWQLGGSIDKNNNYIPPKLQPVVPNSITRRQFFQQAAIKNISGISFITEDEALEGMRGIIPDSLQIIISSMPDDYKFPAKSLLIGAQEFERANPITIVIAIAMGMNDQQIDQFFISAGKL